MRLSAWHPQSGNTMTADVVKVYGVAPRRSFEVIPDGLLEQVGIREGVWVVAVDGDTPSTRLDAAPRGWEHAGDR